MTDGCPRTFCACREMTAWEAAGTPRTPPPYPDSLDDEDRSPGEGEHGEAHRSASTPHYGRWFCACAALEKGPWT